MLPTRPPRGRARILVAQAPVSQVISSPWHSGIEARQMNCAVRVLTINLELPNNGRVRILGDFHHA